MTEIFAFGTLGDIRSIADNCTNRVGAYYAENRTYKVDKKIDIYPSLEDALVSGATSLYALSDIHDATKLFLAEDPEGKVSYIMDRVGSAAVSLNFHDLSPIKINVLSLSYRNRVYKQPDAGLVRTPEAFRIVYTGLRKCLSTNSVKASNTVEPRSVLVLPEAFQKASDGSLPLPWDSVVLPGGA